MTIEISVVICTLDRVDLVRSAVESLTAQTLAPSRFEVLVVDNSADGVARSALADLVAAMPALRLLHEPTPGLSHARNRGTEAATGEVVLFMDDDAVAEPGLLEAHLAAFSSRPAPAATGGRILLRWPTQPPAWMPPSLASYYSGLDLGDELHPLVFPEYPYGVNMAVRRALLLELGGFSAELGRRGTNLISGEERDLFRRVAEVDGLVLYVPDAVAHHCVLPERVSRRWFLRRSWAQGRSDITLGVLARGRPAQGRIAARAGLHLLRAVRHLVVAVGYIVVPGAAGRRMRSASQTVRWLGAAREGLALLRRPS